MIALLKLLDCNQWHRLGFLLDTTIATASQVILDRQPEYYRKMVIQDGENFKNYYNNIDPSKCANDPCPDPITSELKTLVKPELEHKLHCCSKIETLQR